MEKVGTKKRMYAIFIVTALGFELRIKKSSIKKSEKKKKRENKVKVH